MALKILQVTIYISNVGQYDEPRSIKQDCVAKFKHKICVDFWCFILNSMQRKMLFGIEEMVAVSLSELS